MPLSGVRIIEVGLNLAGPLVGSIFADLGADVIKVERPETGDDSRAWGPPFVEEASVPYHAMNRNKRSVTVNFKDPAEMAKLHQLIASSDMFLHNLRPGVAADIGLGPDVLIEANPRLIYCEISAFGHQGPLKDKPGYEILLQAFGGLMSMTGEKDGPPIRMGTSVVDYGTGMWTTIAALAALRRRDQTGRGCIIQTSLFETALFWLGNAFATYKVSGTVPERHPNGSPRQVAFGAFEARNGLMVIGVANSRLFVKLAHTIGRSEWADDPRYQTNADRLAHRDYLVGEIRSIIRQETKEHWMELFDKAGVPSAPILTIPEVLAQPQTEAIDILRKTPENNVELFGLPLSLNGERPAFRNPAPLLGQHTNEVFEQLAQQFKKQPKNKADNEEDPDA